MILVLILLVCIGDLLITSFAGFGTGSCHGFGVSRDQGRIKRGGRVQVHAESGQTSAHEIMLDQLIAVN